MAISKETKLGHIMNLATIANADGEPTEDEQEFVYNVAQELGLTDDDFVKCLEKWQVTDDEDIKIATPRTIEDRVVFIKNMVKLMMLDGDINDNERQYIAQVADKWGLHDEGAVDDLIAIVVAEQLGLDLDD